MRQILFFDSMLIPKIITIVYWLMLAGAVLFGLGAIFKGGFGLGAIFMGIVVMAIGAVGARIYCELLIVLFKIHENIKKLADKQA